MYSPGGITLFDFLVVYNGSKLRTGEEGEGGGLAMTLRKALPLVGGVQCAV